MSRTLQVRFKRLVPSEKIVALAAACYRRMAAKIEVPSECLVSVARPLDAARVLTVVHACLVLGGGLCIESTAMHSLPEVALETALLVLEERVDEHRPKLD